MCKLVILVKSKTTQIHLNFVLWLINTKNEISNFPPPPPFPLSRVLSLSYESLFHSYPTHSWYMQEALFHSLFHLRKICLPSPSFLFLSRQSNNNKLQTLHFSISHEFVTFSPNVYTKQQLTIRDSLTCITKQRFSSETFQSQLPKLTHLQNNKLSFTKPITQHAAQGPNKFVYCLYTLENHYKYPLKLRINPSNTTQIRRARIGGFSSVKVSIFGLEFVGFEWGCSSCC
jgi:hypothetical protein